MNPPPFLVALAATLFAGAALAQGNQANSTAGTFSVDNDLHIAGKPATAK